MTKVLVVPVEGRPRVAQIKPTLSVWQALLNGGYLEAIHGEGWSAYCDEEGKLKSLPPNRTATVLARMFGWHTPDVLCGPVVFFGPPDKDGDETDVPDFLTAILVKDGT